MLRLEKIQLSKYFKFELHFFLFFYCRNKNRISILGTNWLASFECPNNLDVSSLSRQQLYSTYLITMLLIFCLITYNCTLHLFPNKETFMETDLIIYCRVYRSLSTNVFECYYWCIKNEVFRKNNCYLFFILSYLKNPKSNLND